MPFSSDPRKMIAYEARGTFRFFENELISCLNDINLPVAYFHILRLPWSNEGTSQKDISEMAFITPSVTSQLVKKMENDGLLRRGSDPSDGRIKKVFLTKKGEKLKQSILSKVLDIPVRATKNITDEDLETAIRVMQTMRQNLSADSGSGTG